MSVNGFSSDVEYGCSFVSRKNCGGFSPRARRSRRCQAYKCVQYFERSNLSPASSSRTSMPFCVRFQAAMPPEAPLPITMTG
jgi:hypothetical protein